MNVDEGASPPSAATLREQLAVAHERLAIVHADRQHLGVPVLKDRLQRREDLALELTAVELEIASLSDAIPLVVAEEERARQDAEHQEQEGLTAELRPVYNALVRERDDTVTALANRPVPTVEDLRQLRELGRQCEDMRGVLLAATHDGRFARSIDAVQQLERVYRDQQHQRERSFNLLRTPGAPRPGLPDNERLSRLRTLLSARSGASR